MYCLDTDIIIEFFKGNPKIVEGFSKIKKSRISITVLTFYEFLKGAYTSPKQKADLHMLELFLKNVELLNLSPSSCHKAALIYNELKNKGKLLNDADLLIASIAIINNKILVTNNIKHFNRISGLKLENWMGD